MKSSVPGTREIGVRDVLRWLIVVAVALLVIGLAAYARGPEHHHGDDIGTHGTKISLVGTDDE